MTIQTPLIPLSQPVIVRRMAVLTWLELPRVVVVGLVGIALALPLLTGLVGAPWWLVAAGALPICLFGTGLARFAAILSRGEKPTVRDAFQLDAVLGLVVAVAAFGVTALIASGGVARLVGAVLAALLLLVAPYAYAYGAVRGRTSFGAIRGGLILVGYRPGTAVTLLALNCIAGFLVVASLGVFGLFIPCYLFVFACAIVGNQLDDIDHQRRER